MLFITADNWMRYFSRLIKNVQKKSCASIQVGGKKEPKNSQSYEPAYYFYFSQNKSIFFRIYNYNLYYKIEKIRKFVYVVQNKKSY